MGTGAASSVTFSVELPPAALSPNAKGSHWSKKAAAKKAYAETVWIAARDRYEHNLGPLIYKLERYGDAEFGCPWKWAAVELIWHSCQQKDEDNIIAHCKVLIDTLSTKGSRPLGIFEDDKRIAVSAKWAKAKTRAEQHVEVIVTRRDDP